MKVIRAEEETVTIDLKDTEVGEVYTIADGDDVYFVAETKIVNLKTGRETHRAHARSNGWIHKPDAELVVL